MQTLLKAMKANPDAGKPLPSPFRQWPEFGINHRRGQVSLVAGASGGGKSAYATYYAVHARPEIPTLYLSADTDFVTLGTRIAASVVNEHVSLVEERLRAKDPHMEAVVAGATSHIWFYWENNPSTFDIVDEVEAYALVTGRWPHLIVIDNLINVDHEGEAGHQQKDDVMAWFQKLAHRTNAHVMVLQHVTKEYEDGFRPIPKSGLLDSVAKRPRLVLTMFRINDATIGVRIVKNSFGKDDAQARYGPNLGVMFSHSFMSG